MDVDSDEMFTGSGLPGGYERLASTLPDRIGGVKASRVEAAAMKPSDHLIASSRHTDLRETEFSVIEERRSCV